MRNRDLYDLTIQGISARRQPLVLEITTNGFVRGGIFDAQYEYAAKWLNGEASGEKAEHFIAFIFELDEREEWKDEKCWIKANPGLGTIKSLKSLRENVSKALDDPTFLPTLLVKDFNLIENQSQAWLKWSEIHNEATFDPSDGSFSYAVLGVDASDTTDLTAACLLMMRPNDEHIYAMHMAWIPLRALEQAEARGGAVVETACRTMPGLPAGCSGRRQRRSSTSATYWIGSRRFRKSTAFIRLPAAMTRGICETFRLLKLTRLFRSR